MLKRSGLRRTSAREAILAILADASRPLSHHEILKELQDPRSIDRVTVYRTLASLQAAGLLHRIQGSDGAWRFCRHVSDSAGRCSGNHIHFLCSNCDRMTCLPDQPLPWVTAPPGAAIVSKQLVVHGTCADCGSRKKRGR